MNKNKEKYAKLSTSKLLERQAVNAKQKWILFVGLLVLVLAVPMAAMLKVMMLVVAIAVLPAYKMEKKIVDEELANRSYTEIEKETAAKRGRLGTIGFVIVLVVVGVAFSIANTDSSDWESNRPWEELGVSEREYMETYYHIAEGMPR